MGQEQSGTRYCACGCGKPIPTGAKSNQVYVSDNCRMRAYRTREKRKAERRERARQVWRDEVAKTKKNKAERLRQQKQLEKFIEESTQRRDAMNKAERQQRQQEAVSHVYGNKVELADSKSSKPTHIHYDKIEVVEFPQYENGPKRPDRIIKNEQGEIILIQYKPISAVRKNFKIPEWVIWLTITIFVTSFLTLISF